MKKPGYFTFFAALTLIAFAAGASSQAVSPYEIDKDYWFSDQHTIKTNNGWTFHIKELGKYNVTGSVLGVKYYRESHLLFSPADFCIGWGEVIERPHDKWSNYSMGYRRCEQSYTPKNYKIELSEKYIDSHLSNNHLIPSNKDVFNELMNVKEGDFIEMQGFLVSVTGENENGSYIPPWTSDTKNTFKVCEIVLVENIKIIEMPDESQGMAGFVEDIFDENPGLSITAVTVFFILLMILFIRRMVK